MEDQLWAAQVHMSVFDTHFVNHSLWAGPGEGPGAPSPCAGGVLWSFLTSLSQTTSEKIASVFSSLINSTFTTFHIVPEIFCPMI
jgi:hypothetical protein